MTKIKIALSVSAFEHDDDTCVPYPAQSHALKSPDAKRRREPILKRKIHEIATLLIKYISRLRERFNSCTALTWISFGPPDFIDRLEFIIQRRETKVSVLAHMNHLNTM